MKIESTKVTSDCVLVEVRRDNGEIYTIELLPKQDEIIMNLSGLHAYELNVTKPYANRVTVAIDKY